MNILPETYHSQMSKGVFFQSSSGMESVKLLNEKNDNKSYVINSYFR